MKQCEQCGIEFLPRRKTGRFCSRACSNRANFKGVKRKHTPLPRRPKTCEHCEISFIPGNGRAKWCPACGPDEESRKFLYRYGLSQPERQKLIEIQAGLCALCDREPEYVDHDHQTGVIRGLLCCGCNVALNRAEIPGWMEKVTEYLKNPTTLKARYRR